jgi:hypothetical protein
VVAIGSVKDLATEDGTQDEAGFGEKIQLAAGGACACANVAGDLAKEEGLVGGSEEKRQDLAPGLAEEEVSDEWGGCTHFEYNCTQNEYGDEQNSYSIVPLKPEAGLNGPPVIYFARMSFDLGVWHSERRLTRDEAAAIYVQLCENWPYLDGENSALGAFYDELTRRWPEIGTVPDDRVDDLDYCPWSCAISHSGIAVVMSCVWPKSEEVASFAHELADRHRLVVFDPQANAVHLPEDPNLQSGEPRNLSDDRLGIFRRLFGRRD